MLPLQGGRVDNANAPVIKISEIIRRFAFGFSGSRQIYPLGMAEELTPTDDAA